MPAANKKLWYNAWMCCEKFVSKRF